jgi:hypothetical protein
VQDVSQWNHVKPRTNSGLTGIYWHIVSSTVYRKDVQMNSDVFSCFFLSVFLSLFLIGVFSGDWLPFLHMGETASGISKTLWRVNQGHVVQPTVIISAMSLHKKQRYIHLICLCIEICHNSSSTTLQKQINWGWFLLGLATTPQRCRVQGDTPFRHDVQMRVPCVQKAKERLQVTKGNFQRVKIGWFFWKYS